MMKSFKKVSSPNIDGDFVRCLGCSEIISEADQATHYCDELGGSQKGLGLIFSADTPEQRIAAIDRYEELKDAEWNKDLAEVEKKCKEADLRKLVHSVMVENIMKVRKYKEREYSRNDDLRSRGVPLSERLKVVDKQLIDLYERYERKLTDDLKHFRVKPVRDWLGRSDLDWARRSGKGLRFIIMINLERVYSVPEKTKK